jgi:small subunit ribosomal protein S17
MSETENENQNTEDGVTEVPQEAETVEAAVERGEAEPLPGEVPAEPEAAAAPPAEEPVPDVPAETAEAPPAAAPAAAEAPAEEAAPQRGAKKKKKRLPRAQRRQRTKPMRERPAERKPITRLPKPVSERGQRQERRGVVVSNAMDKTIVVKVDTIKAHTKYKKVVRRSVKFHAHDPENQANVGDIVRIIETRPISKTKNWRLAEVVEAAK